MGEVIEAMEKVLERGLDTQIEVYINPGNISDW
jgi:hypothetical protein